MVWLYTPQDVVKNTVASFSWGSNVYQRCVLFRRRHEDRDCDLECVMIKKEQCKNVSVISNYRDRIHWLIFNGIFFACCTTRISASSRVLLRFSRCICCLPLTWTGTGSLSVTTRLCNHWTMYGVRSSVRVVEVIKKHLEEFLFVVWNWQTYYFCRKRRIQM